MLKSLFIILALLPIPSKDDLFKDWPNSQTEWTKCSYDLNSKEQLNSLKLSNNSSYNTFWITFQASDSNRLIKNNSTLKGLDTLTQLGPSFCECKKDQDTITCFGGIAYVNGFGFAFNIVKDSFSSMTWISHNEKSNLKLERDSIFSSTVEVPSTFEKLILEKSQEYSIGDSITGVLTLQSSKINKLNKKAIDTIRFWQKVYFKSEIQKEYRF